MSKAVAYAVMKNGSAVMLAKPGNATNSDWQPLYATDHAEDLARALDGLLGHCRHFECTAVVDAADNALNNYHEATQ